MSPKHATGRCLPFLVAVLAMWFITPEYKCVAQGPIEQAWKDHPDVQGCKQCHEAGIVNDDDVLLSRKNEYKFWMEFDKHATASRRITPLSEDEVEKEKDRLVEELYSRSLPDAELRSAIQSIKQGWVGKSNELSKVICDKLGIDIRNKEGYEEFRNSCLTCHGGYHYSPDNSSADDKYFGFESKLPQPGISCNYCHQEPGKGTAWIAKHGIKNEDPDWPLRSGQEKSLQGMRDLVNTAAQAQNCYDCHIGNRDKNMFVTHVMYAAGHPPLPGIELETFCSSMPQHWQGESKLYDSLTTANYPQRDEYFQKNFPEIYYAGRPAPPSPQAVYWNTRKIMVGAVAARLQTVELMVKSTTPDRWADYSLYDCAACHHELREPSDRQERGYTGAPGRPRQAEWPGALMNVALAVAGSDIRAKVDASEAKLAAAFAQTPFGEPAVVEPIAVELHAHLVEALNAVQGKALTVGAKVIIRLLASTPKEELLVYDSARQVVWAIQAIAAELDAKGDPLPEALAQKIAALGDPKSTGLDTVLPAGRQVFIYDANLNADLERRAAYQPSVLAEQLAVIAKEIALPVAPAAATASVVP